MTQRTTTSVQRTGALLQDGAASPVLREAFFGVHRFEAFQRHLGISRSVLARALKRLVEQGILERRKYQDRPERFEYHLTESGLELYPVFLAMKAWGDRWLGEEGAHVTLRHEVCGEESRPRMTCDHCGEPVFAREMRFEIVPLPGALRPG